VGAFPFSPSTIDAAAKPRAAIPLDVVVAEDEQPAREIIVRSVRAAGHLCRAAVDGADALRLLEERRADVVIADWEMPAVSGAELCRRVRDAEDGAYTYFILMTGHHDRAHLLEGMAAGADDYQKKPIDLDELEARLVSAARVVALHRRLSAREDDLRRDSSALFAVSRTDALTGVGNRLRMEEELAAALSRAKRYGHRFTLAIVDVDHFKEFNDAFGHLAGDDALKKVATTLRAGLRSTDSVYRYGGEEFVVVLPEQGLSDGFGVVDRMRRALEEQRVRHPGPCRMLTVSAGVAELDLSVDADVGTWLARADAALYLAKSNGRNRVEANGTRGPMNA
jgi:two-component system, cell cycle response regulator